MWHPDLMLTKAVAMRRQEAQRTAADPYPTCVAGPVYRNGHAPGRGRQLGALLGNHLVTWGRRLQQYGEPQTLLR